MVNLCKVIVVELGFRSVLNHKTAAHNVAGVHHNFVVVHICSACLRMVIIQLPDT